MRRFSLCLVVFTFASSAFAAGFLDSLSAEQRKQMGLDQLTAEQSTAINAAVANYQAGTVAVQSQQAAETAVADYKAKQEPGVIARALGNFKQKQEQQDAERRACHVRGSFSGWSGGTLFPLDNDQVWQQVGTDVYYLKPVEDAIVELRKSPSGYYRIYLSDGRWVTVKRVR